MGSGAADAHQGDTNVINSDSLTEARWLAGMTVDELTARAAAIGHASIEDFERSFGPTDEHEFLREDLAQIVELAELDELGEPDWLPANHPYLRWFAEALDTSVIRLIDIPVMS
jgi:hypothetical protein